VDASEVLERSRRLGAVESESPPATADLVILATPVGAILEWLDQPLCRAELILDVGSTKAAICRRAEARNLPFLGGHPMTGSERAGPEAASAELFHGETFFLCPVATTPPEAQAKIESVLRAIGAQPVVIDADRHDRLVAQLSHLPQILSSLVANQTTESIELAGPGWKSVTRLAASPFHVWRDILETSESLPEELRSFVARLQSLLSALEKRDFREIENIFERANRIVSGERHE
jgi:prephenate dehydrogenase